MKAITLTQPWAWSILHAGKRIENRQRKDRKRPANICNHRGPLILHAAKGMKIRDYEKAVAFMVGHHVAQSIFASSGLSIIPPRLQGAGDDWLPRGVIVGRCIVAGEIFPVGDAMLTDKKHLMPEQVREQFDLRWWMGGHGLLLTNVEPASNLVAARGMLGCWTVPDDVLEQVRWT